MSAQISTFKLRSSVSVCLIQDFLAMFPQTFSKDELIEMRELDKDKLLHVNIWEKHDNKDGFLTVTAKRRNDIVWWVEELSESSLDDEQRKEMEKLLYRKATPVSKTLKEMPFLKLGQPQPSKFEYLYSKVFKTSEEFLEAHNGPDLEKIEEYRLNDKKQQLITIRLKFQEKHLLIIFVRDDEPRYITFSFENDQWEAFHIESDEDFDEMSDVIYQERMKEIAAKKGAELAKSSEFINMLNVIKSETSKLQS